MITQLLTTLPQEIIDTLVGTILGDGRMNFTTFSNASFYFEQSINHKHYLYYLFGLLSVYANSLEPHYRRYVDGRTGRITESYWFSLKSSPVFGIFAELFYKPVGEGYIKHIPWAHMYDLLTPRAIAYWIMDDGQYVARGGITLCTDNYAFKDVLALMLILEQKFGLVCSIHTKDYANRSKKYYRIYVSGKSLPNLRSLVESYMHPTMMYKLDK